MKKVIYVENKPWAIIASYSLDRDRYEVLPYVGKPVKDGESIITSNPPEINSVGSIIITPKSLIACTKKGKLTKNFNHIIDLYKYLFKSSWVINATEEPNYLLYLIVDTYGIFGINHIDVSDYDKTEFMNRDVSNKYALDANSYLNDSYSNKVVGLNVYVLRYNRFNMFVMLKENPDLLVEIDIKRGHGYLHVMGKDYKKYLQFMENIGMHPFDTNSTRGGYLHQPIDAQVDDIDIQTVKETVEEFYKK